MVPSRPWGGPCGERGGRRGPASGLEDGGEGGLEGFLARFRPRPPVRGVPKEYLKVERLNDRLRPGLPPGKGKQYAGERRLFTHPLPSEVGHGL